MNNSQKITSLQVSKQNHKFVFRSEPFFFLIQKYERNFKKASILHLHKNFENNLSCVTSFLFLTAIWMFAQKFQNCHTKMTFEEFSSFCRPQVTQKGKKFWTVPLSGIIKFKIYHRDFLNTQFFC